MMEMKAQKGYPISLDVHMDKGIRLQPYTVMSR